MFRHSFIVVTVLLVCTIVANTRADTTPERCPGLVQVSSGSSDCTVPCQQATCAALTAFFNATYNASADLVASWSNKYGWEAALMQNCSQIVAATVDGAPGYCTWHGVTCCSGLLQYLGICSANNAVIEVKMEVNGLVGSIEDLALQQAIAQLHDCGMVSLSMLGNTLSGSLTSFWGQLNNLKFLNLGKWSLRTAVCLFLHGVSYAHRLVGEVYA